MLNTFPTKNVYTIETGVGAASSTPVDIATYLRKRGWENYGEDPNTYRDLWYGTAGNEMCGYCTWEQAVAYEMYLFMNIGPD